MAVASGSIAYTGTYTIDENTKTIHANIETGTFPNLVGAPNQRRIITSITADEMKFTNPRTAAGLTLEIVWKRAKWPSRPASPVHVSGSMSAAARRPLVRNALPSYIFCYWPEADVA